MLRRDLNQRLLFPAYFLGIGTSADVCYKVRVRARYGG